MSTKKVQKEVQYYKVINPAGHHGLKYKVGLNTDPKALPLHLVGSCEEGAIYFTDKEHLLDFRGYGFLIAWVTPKSTIKPDKENKWKAHTIEITKMLPFKEALPLIFSESTPRELYKIFKSFNVDCPEEILSKLPLREQFELLSYRVVEKVNFIKKNQKDSSFLSYVKKAYKDRYNTLSCTFVALILVENGMDWRELTDEDLHEVLQPQDQLTSDEKKLQKIIKKQMTPEEWKLATRIARY